MDTRDRQSLAENARFRGAEFSLCTNQALALVCSARVEPGPARLFELAGAGALLGATAAARGIIGALVGWALGSPPSA